jgi:hypothetical protein
MIYKTPEEIKDEVEVWMQTRHEYDLKKELTYLYIERKELQERKDKDSERVQNNIKNHELYIREFEKKFKPSWVINAMRSACLYENEKELAVWLELETILEKAEKLLEEQNKAGNQTPEGPYSILAVVESLLEEQNKAGTQTSEGQYSILAEAKKLLEKQNKAGTQTLEGQYSTEDFDR